jgi:hypothetical protein
MTLGGTLTPAQVKKIWDDMRADDLRELTVGEPLQFVITLKE